MDIYNSVVGIGGGGRRGVEGVSDRKKWDTYNTFNSKDKLNMCMYMYIYIYLLYI